MILSKKNIDNIDLSKLIEEKISTGKTDEFLLVVPTNRKLRRLKKEVISKSPNSTAAKINVETLSTLTGKILRENDSFINLSEAASTVMIEQSADLVELKYFSNYGDSIPAGTLDKIKSVISEYKKRGVTPEILTKDISLLKPGDRQKTQDIANIYSVYLNKCKTLKAYEIGDIYSELLQLDKKIFADIFRKLFPSVNVISIGGFDEFTLPEIELINIIAEIKNVLLFINFDYDNNNLNLFSHLDECFGRLVFKGFSEQKTAPIKEANDFVSVIKKNLFARKKTEENKLLENAAIITALTREKEIELIAKEIKELIINRKTTPNNIAVVFNIIDHYSFLVRDIFADYGIPLNLSDRLALNNSFPVTALINFLEILENDFYYKNLMRALHSGFIELEGIEVTNLSAIAKELKITSGKNNWLFRIREALKKNKSDKNDFARRKDEKLLLAEKNILTIAELLEPFSINLTIKEFNDKLIKLIANLKISVNVLTKNQGTEENIKSLSVLIETMNEIFSLLEQEEGSDKKHELKFYLNQIRTAAGWARYNVKEKSDFGVLVTTLDEIRGLKFDYLFIGGLNDGELPTRYSPEIFYSKAFMIKKERSHLFEQRYRFYQALGCWQKGLYLSYSLSDNKKEIVESSFLMDLLKLGEIKVKTEKDYSNSLYNNEEILKMFGEAIGNNETETIKEIGNILPIDSGKIKNTIITENIRNEDYLKPSVYNGFLTSDSFPDAEKEYRLDTDAEKNLSNYAQNVYSISQLETFAKCPFKYFVERVLKLDIIEEPTEEIEAIELGSTLHSILFEFYTAMRKNGLTVTDNFVEADRLIFEIAKNKVENIGFNSPSSFYEKEKIFGLNGDKESSILYKFLEEERKNTQNIPSFFEVSFGRTFNDNCDELLSSEKPLDVNGVQLRGKIDRIDIYETEQAAIVVDYKLGGKKIKTDELYRGIQLQLPVYLSAIQTLLKEYSRKEYKPAGMEIYSLKYSEKDFGKKPINLKRGKQSLQEKIKLNKDLILQVSSFIKEYVAAIVRGIFHLSPYDDREQMVCKYCDLKRTCRVQEITSN